MAESAVSFIVERLGDLLVEEAKLLRGVNEQVKQMQVELRLMQCFLRDVDRRQDDDETIRNWALEIRDAAYDIEDIIETFALTIASKLKDAWLFKKVKIRHEVAHKIEDIKTRMSNLTRCLQTYGVAAARKEGQSFALQRRRQLRWSYSHIGEEIVVGFEEDIKKLVGELVKEDKHYQFVSICGMGGIGKTTLAKAVYHHSEVRRHFEGFAWAYVSLEYKQREVWEGILISLTSPTQEERKEIQNMGEAELAKKLCEVQKKKKCLVIVDDIWFTETWQILSAAFPIGKAALGGRILLTTRNKEVAVQADPRGFLHEPGYLKEEESWELFRKKAFPHLADSDFKISKAMESLGREMVGCCKGLPLAIVVLGGLLATKETLAEWDMVHRNIKSYLQRGEGSERGSRLSEVLSLSYHELPYQLKSCFLYLSHFPDGFEIPTKKLVQLWIAEGFVPSKYEIDGEDTMEDIAEGYLSDLLNRCMVQVGERGSTGRIKTCRLHDLMRDLCLSKAKEENFLQIVRPSQRNGGADQSSSSMIPGATTKERIRRLAIPLSENVDELIPSTHIGIPHVRSLLYFNGNQCRFKRIQSSKPIFNFKLLKILDLEGIKQLEGKLPEEIGRLIHLRFLSLKSTRIWELPSSIANLGCLQTLDLRTIDKVCWESTVKVPDVIWRLERLRHLYFPKWCCNVSDKLQIAVLRNLQTLVNFPAGKCDVEDLLTLTKLRKLVLNNPRQFENIMKIFASPNNALNYLQSLSLKTDTLSFAYAVVNLGQIFSRCPRLYKLHIEASVQNLPEYCLFPPNLTKLTLWGAKLREDPMATLERLPSLKFLSGWKIFMGKKMVCSANGFPELKTLLIRGLHNLEEWTVKEGAMTKLSHLSISDCYKMKAIPDGLRFVTTLQELEIRWMHSAFKRRLQTGEDLDIVQHIPSIIFLD